MRHKKTGEKSNMHFINLNEKIVNITKLIVTKVNNQNLIRTKYEMLVVKK